MKKFIHIHEALRHYFPVLDNRVLRLNGIEAERNTYLKFIESGKHRGNHLVGGNFAPNKKFTS